MLDFRQITFVLFLEFAYYDNKIEKKNATVPLPPSFIIVTAIITAAATTTINNTTTTISSALINITTSNKSWSISVCDSDIRFTFSISVLQ